MNACSAPDCTQPLARPNQRYCSARCRQRGKRDRDRSKRDRLLRESRARLSIIPLDLATANTFVLHYHRHNKPVRGAKFCIGVVDETSLLRGVAIVGRPVARLLDDSWTLEVTRVATDGCPNACSALYGAARRIAFDLGYHRLVTYTLHSESGASLRGAGWKRVAVTRPALGKGWQSRPGREEQKVCDLPKCRWEALVGGKQGKTAILYPWQ